MILYEYPFNERVRAYLRLEHLFQRLGELITRDSAIDHHFALATVFEIMDVGARADLKSDILKDIERQKAHVNSFRGNPAVAEGVLDQVVRQLDQGFAALNEQMGKAGHELTENEWLMGIRSRSVIPGGTCSFDLPAYHAWQQRPPTQRRADLERWAATLMPLARAVHLLLGLLRDAGIAQKVMASHGQYQQTLPQGRQFQLLRLMISPVLNLIPEISGNRLMVSIRLMSFDAAAGKLVASGADAPFDLTLCAIG